MREEIHKARELLFEADRMAQRMSSAVSNQQAPAELAPLVDAMRHSVLSAMRVAHALELAVMLVEKPS